MTITEGMPRRAFNLLPKCNESGQKSGHLGLYQKWEEICKWFIASCGDSSVTHVKMTLSWKLKGIRRHLYFPNVGVGKQLSQDNRGKLFHQAQFGAYAVLVDLIPSIYILFWSLSQKSANIIQSYSNLNKNHSGFIFWLFKKKKSNKIVVNKSKKDHILCIIWFINMCMLLTKVHSNICSFFMNFLFFLIDAHLIGTHLPHVCFFAILHFINLQKTNAYCQLIIFLLCLVPV